MANKKFVWLLGDQSPSGKGPDLKHGQSYDVADFGEAIVAEWVRTGAAKWEKESKKGGGE